MGSVGRTSDGGGVAEAVLLMFMFVCFPALLVGLEYRKSLIELQGQAVSRGHAVYEPSRGGSPAFKWKD